MNGLGNVIFLFMLEKVIDMNEENFLKTIKTPWKFRWYLFTKLPLAWLMGIRLLVIDHSHCTVILPFKKRNLNPFRSMYFAAQVAAAELSTGILLMMAREATGDVSMLVSRIESEFYKKAVTDLRFTCNQGEMITDIIRKAVVSGDPMTIGAESIGKDEHEDTVSITRITWSVKRRKK